MSFGERLSLARRTALVTGGSKGLGAEIARGLAEAGADVAIVGRDSGGLAETEAAVTATGRSCLPIAADLASVEETQEAAAQALDRFGTIDVLVNNAGIVVLEDLLTASPAQWDRVQAINLRAPFLLAQALAPQMIAQRQGKIINISAQSGVYAITDHAAYCASKGGLNMLTKVMAAEWARHNIQANAVCPTVVMTAMGEQAWSDPAKAEPMLAKIPLGRFGQPVEVADLVVYLSSAASDLVCGQVIMIDGGFSAM